MKQVSKLNELNNLSYFDSNSLSQIVDVSRNSLYANINRWLKRGYLIQLKKGMYVTREFMERHAGSDGYYEFISNKLHEPSYLSCEYVLQQYGILTEAVYAITAVTLKTKREYENRLGRFLYRHVQDRLFTGFEIVDRDEFQVKTATKAKALFDYLYLKFYRVTPLTKGLVASLRLNLEDFSEQDMQELGMYCALTRISKFEVLPETIKAVL